MMACSMGVIADGRGGHRNNYRQASQNGIYDDDDDIRGTIYLWGSVVQFQRGYIKRNYPGPYNVSWVLATISNPL